MTTAAITKEHIKNGFTYEEYRQMGKDLVAQGKTTGNNQSHSYIEFSKLNNYRMDRADKNIIISDELKQLIKSIKRPMIWMALVELWCGDAAQNIPAFAKMEELNKGKIRFVILLRDENPEVMDAYLTNGSRSIPKLVALDAQTMETLFEWGPRPAPAQQIMLDYRAAGSPDDVDYKKEIQLWYMKDLTATLQKEFVGLLGKVEV